MSVSGRLASIGALIEAEDPFNRLPEQIFLDAQAVIQWIRLGVFEEIMDLVPPASETRRFRLGNRAFRETIGVLNKRYPDLKRREIEEHLSSWGNLQIDDPTPADSIVGRRAVDLRTRMCILVGEDPAEAPSRHMGEAESIAVIETYAPGSMFVTADGDAAAVASAHPDVVHAWPLAFVAGVTNDAERVSGIWKAVCGARRCFHQNGWVIECVEALACDKPAGAAGDRSPVSANIRNADTLLEWSTNDLNGLVRVLA